MSLKRKEPTQSQSRQIKSKIYDYYNDYNDSSYDEKDIQRIDSFYGTYQMYKNTPILDTLFTVGMEFEPNLSNASYYNKYDYLYDRMTVFQSRTNKSSVTIESNDITNIKNITNIDDQDDEDNLCRYNIELNIGILGLFESTKLNHFIDNKYYFIPQIETELEEFKFGFYQPNKDEHIRRLYLNKQNITDSGFSDCALSHELTLEEKESSKYYYIKAYDNPENMNIMPQITIGISYALYPILMTKNPNIVTKLSISIYNIIKEKNLYNTNSYKVFEGFIYVILNYSLTAAYFHHKDIVKRMEGQGINVSKSKGFDYFKSLFPLKPRTNLAESYKYLSNEYEGFDELFDKVYDNVIKEYNNYLSKFDVYYLFDPSSIKGYTELVIFHINLLKEITSKDILLEDINKRLNKNDLIDESYIYQDIVSFIINQEDHFIIDLLKIIGLVNIIYLMFQIKNPRKVVRIRFLDRSKVGNDCKLLDGYFFSYEDDHRTMIDQLERKKLIEVIDNKIYDFAHTSDPVILNVTRGKICTEGKRREEIFELMPTNSNLVIEFRNPNTIARYIEPEKKILSFSQIIPFLKNFFEGLHMILIEEIADFYTYASSIDKKEKDQSKSYCSLMFKPKIKKLL